MEMIHGRIKAEKSNKLIFDQQFKAADLSRFVQNRYVKKQLTVLLHTVICSGMCTNLKKNYPALFIFSDIIQANQV